MTTKPILFFLDREPAAPWLKAFAELAPNIEVRTQDSWGDVREASYAFVWHPTPGLLKTYENIDVIYSLGAGVDHLITDPDLPTDTPIVRMADRGLKEGMAEYVVMSVISHHRQMPRMRVEQQKQNWAPFFPKPSSEITVGIMGYGTLGHHTAQQLKTFHYPINTWSTSPKEAEDGVTHFYGKDTLSAFLGRSDIVVNLLPSTTDTYHILNSDSLAACKQGAAIINVGRGSALDLTALIAAIKAGHIKAATLDVFEQEPLPSDHPAWGMDEIVITPHISAVTQIRSAVEYVLESIRDYEAGKPLINQLDRNKGY